MNIVRFACAAASSPRGAAVFMAAVLSLQPFAAVAGQGASERNSPALKSARDLAGTMERAGARPSGSLAGSLRSVFDRFWDNSASRGSGDARVVLASFGGEEDQPAAAGTPRRVTAAASDVPSPQGAPVEPSSFIDRAKHAVSTGALEAYSWFFRSVNRVVPWHKLPTPIAVLNLAALRYDLRKLNLHGTSHLDTRHGQSPGEMPERYRDGRSPDGRYNDPNDPDMGRAGAPFGRNKPLNELKCGPLPGDPDPREISRRLMTRKEFKPATIVNNLAMTWIQFQVHDWVQHGRDSKRPIVLPGGASGNRQELDSTETVPAENRASGSQHPPVFVNKGTHWWDGSQIYGSSAERLAQVRSGKDGKLSIGENGLLPIDPAQANPEGRTGVDLTGRNDNYWLGLSMMHTLFSLEHNAIAERLKKEYPTMDDDKLFDKARLVNAALIAKIHTVEWTPAILPNPALQVGMKSNWWGLTGAVFGKDSWVRGIMPKSELLTGIPGSKTEHHSADYSLTEEFDIVYRMHTLVPDSFEMHSAADGAHLATMQFDDLQGVRTRDAVTKVGMGNLFYSFGISHPGAIRLNNFPKGLQNFKHFSGRTGDLAAADIIRARERCVPRYNDFREMVRMPRVKTFEELVGGDQELAREISDVYGGDIDKVDAMVGMFAEPLPEGFGFSDTAFRIFIVMASRRLKSDRFLSEDYRPEVYTAAGLDWVENTTMKDVLLRHYPELAPAMEGVDNAFRGSWKKLGT